MPSPTTFFNTKKDEVTGRPRENASDTPESGNEALSRRLKKLFRLDCEAAKTWRAEAKEDFQFAAGEQWADEDKAHLKELMRPIITFNRILPIVNSVSGHEISNRQEVRYIPREEGDTKQNELLTEAARWFRDTAEADDEDSEAFLNAAICGMGWTETTLDYEQEQYGCPSVISLDPLEMVWDCNARKKNLTDAERVWRVRKMSLARAKELFPDKSAYELDAKWAENELSDRATPDDQRAAMLYQETGTEEERIDDDTFVTLVHCEWKVKEDVFTVADQQTGRTIDLTQDEYKKLKKRAEQLKIPVYSTKRQKTVVKQAFIGSVVLQYSDGICGDHFRYGCVTGYRDAIKGHFFGVVRGMKDPQRWANKWLSQTLDLMNSTVKGGIIYEEDAVDDPKEFERTWARADIPTLVKRGALTNPHGKKIEAKPATPFPAAFFQLMEFAINAIRDVTGISVEMLGLREADQPASLEFQRRQAGMTILAPLFQNLKRYRHEQGRVMLYLIQTYLSDGRLVRILGNTSNTAKYVPLLKQADIKYDIIVDDMPTSPNNKEMVWAMIGERIWELPPPIQMALLKYSPFPQTVVEEVQKAAQEMAQGPQAQMQQQLMQLEGLVNQATAMLKQAQTVKTMAEAEQVKQETAMGGEGADPANMIKAQGELAIKSQESQAKIAEGQAKLKLKETETAGKLQLKQQETQAGLQMKGQEMQLDAMFRGQEMQNQQRMADQQFAADQQTQERQMAMDQQRSDREFAAGRQDSERQFGMERERMQGDQSLARQQQGFDQRQASSQQKFDQGMARQQAKSQNSLAQQKLKQQAAKPKPSGGNR